MSCTKALYTNHPAQSPNCHPISTHWTVCISAEIWCRQLVGNEQTINGYLSGDSQVIEQGNYIESPCTRCIVFTYNCSPYLK